MRGDDEPTASDFRPNYLKLPFMTALGVLLSVAFYAFTWTSGAIALGPREPFLTDTELMARFEGELGAFEELRRMLRALPNESLYIRQGQISGSRAGKHAAFFERDAQWHEWESKDPVALEAILDTLGIEPAQYDRISTLVRAVGGHSISKGSTWDGTVQIRILMWDGGLFGGVKWIEHRTREPATLVSTTDSDAWHNESYAALPGQGWYIAAAR